MLRIERNIKRLIKKRGFKLATFSQIYLKLSYQTFNHQLKNDNLKINTIVKLLKVLNVSFNELVKGEAINKSIEVVKVENNNTVQKVTPVHKAPITKKPIITDNKYKGLEGLIG